MVQELDILEILGFKKELKMVKIGRNILHRREAWHPGHSFSSFLHHSIAICEKRLVAQNKSDLLLKNRMYNISSL
jgi:hypothetical protein